MAGKSAGVECESDLAGCESDWMAGEPEYNMTYVRVYVLVCARFLLACVYVRECMRVR
jgi:hypothetical protein